MSNENPERKRKPVIKINQSDETDQHDPTDNNELPHSPPLRPSGGYRKLRSFNTTTIIYDATVSFCQRFIDKHSRTIDQMVQAARSGRQNIAEGSRASATSSQTELRLVNVARASLDELLLDYEDFLRQRGKRQWLKDDPEARAVREIAKTLPSYLPDRSNSSDLPATTPYAPWLNHENAEIMANTIICLIHQANYLLDQQIAALEQEFIQEGGYSERLAAARREHRKQENPSDQSNQSDKSSPPPPACPQCGKPMRRCTARQGTNAGQQFWGCSGFPDCKGIRPIDHLSYPSNPPDMSDKSDLSSPSCPLCNKPMRQRTARQGKNTGQSFWGCAGFPDCKGTRPMDDPPH